MLEDVDLILQGLHEARMRVPDRDRGHAGEGVEIFLPVTVVEELHAPLDDLDGPGEHGAGQGQEVLGAQGGGLLGRGPGFGGRGVLGLHEGLRSIRSSRDNARQSPTPDSRPSSRFTGEGMREMGFQGLFPYSGAAVRMRDRTP